MEIHLRWVLVACLALAIKPAMAAESKGSPEPLESVKTMHVDGQILIDTQGRVELFEIETDVLEPLEVALLRLVREWRFNPVLVDGEARRATARMRVILAAHREDDGYRVSIDNVAFPEDKPAKPPITSPPIDSSVISGRSFRSPRYPRELEMQGVAGTVLVAVLAGPGGKTAKAKATQTMLYDVRGRDEVLRKAIAVMERSALSAARDWTFNMPVVREGDVPKDLTVMVPVEFKLGKTALPGQWRTVVRSPKRPIDWLPASQSARAAGVADFVAGEMLPLSSAFSLVTEVIGLPVM